MVICAVLYSRKSVWLLWRDQHGSVTLIYNNIFIRTRSTISEHLQHCNIISEGIFCKPEVDAFHCH